jgi:hypothetical protein
MRGRWFHNDPSLCCTGQKIWIHRFGEADCILGYGGGNKLFPISLKQIGFLFNINGALFIVKKKTWPGLLTLKKPWT